MFKDKTVVITGGSSGVGRELAMRLAKRGARLALLARGREMLEETRNEIADAHPGARVDIFSCDVTDSAAVDSAFRAVADSQLGAPHVLINSAGILIENYFEKLPLEVFRKTMDINFFGTLHCIRAALPFFKGHGGGRIINMSSLSGVMGVFGYSAYCASKYAVKGLTDTLRVELGPQKIKFHVVCPPEFDSPMVREMNKTRTPENLAMAHLLPVLTIPQVADEILSGVRAGRYEIVPGAIPRAAYFLDKLLPGPSRALTDMTIRRHYKGPSTD
jgi:3-dehydrosphinganine reductase